MEANKGVSNNIIKALARGYDDGTPLEPLFPYGSEGEAVVHPHDILRGIHVRLRDDTELVINHGGSHEGGRIIQIPKKQDVKDTELYGNSDLGISIVLRGLGK